MSVAAAHAVQALVRTLRQHLPQTPPEANGSMSTIPDIQVIPPKPCREVVYANLLDAPSEERHLPDWIMQRTPHLEEVTRSLEEAWQALEPSQGGGGPAELLWHRLQELMRRRVYGWLVKQTDTRRARMHPQSPNSCSVATWLYPPPADLLSALEGGAQEVMHNGGPPNRDEEYCFVLDGAIWHIRFRDEKGAFPTRKGLECTARLLAFPNKSQSARAVAGDNNGPPLGEHTHQDALDSQAVQAYRERLQAIVGAKEEARKHDDETEWSRLDEESQHVQEQLRTAVGLRGRSRNLQKSEPAKQAETVRKALRAVRERLAQRGLPLLAKHLKTSIRKEGTSFAYRPDDPAPDWKIER